MTFLQKFLLTKFISGLIFTVPTWVAFQTRYLSYPQMATMELITSLISILMQLPTGALADKFGRKPAVFIGFLIAGLGNIITAFAPNGLMIMLGFWVIAIGTTFVSGADVALLYDYLKHHHQESDFATVNAKGILLYRTAMILAILSGGHLYNLFVGLPMIAKGLAFLISAIIFLTMDEISSLPQTQSSIAYRIQSGFLSLFTTSKSSLSAIYYVLVGGITWSVVYQWMNTLAADYGYSPTAQSWLFSGIYIVTNTAMISTAKYKSKISDKLILILFPAIIIIGTLPMKWQTPFTMIPFLSLLVFASGSRFSLLDGWINHQIDSTHRATTLSALNLMVTLLTGLIIFTLGQIQQVYLTPTVVTILGIFSLITLTPVTYKLLKLNNS